MCKFAAAFLSHSTSTLAEAVHSLADTGNQALLLVGMRLAARPADERFPFGRASERYFWPFVVALMLFSVGGAFAVFEGIHKLMGSDPVPEHGLGWSYGVLGVSLLFESLSFRVAWNEFRKVARDRPLAKVIFGTRDPTIPLVLAEDLTALAGLVLALLSVGLMQMTGLSVFDAIGSILIGLLLAAVALVIARITHGLLIGESADPEEQARALVLTEAVPEVNAVTQLLTMHLGPDVVILAMKIAFRDGLDGTLAAIEERRTRSKREDPRRAAADAEDLRRGRLARRRAGPRSAPGARGERRGRAGGRQAAGGAVRPIAATMVLFAVGAALSFLPARHVDASAGDVAAAHGRRRVGLVFDVGGRGDKSFNDAAYTGLVRAERELGIEGGYLEPVGSEDREAAMRLFAARGFDLVIGVGFIFSGDVDRVARDYPSVHFACIDYAAPPGGAPPNVEGLDFREEEGSFLVGAVAGFISKTHEVGFIGGMEGPLIRKFELGYAAGVRAACADCVVHAAYVGASPDAFRDPAKGKALAISEISQGADVLYHAAGASGHGVLEAARESHVWAIGVDTDQYDEMPGTIVTSMLKRGDVAVFDAIRAVVEGRFVAGTRELGLRDGAVSYVRDGAHGAGIPEDVKAKVDALRADVVSGKLRVPTE